jgi:uncharacterized lipoprotein YddW (UPF0748 family)
MTDRHSDYIPFIRLILLALLAAGPVRADRVLTLDLFTPQGKGGAEPAWRAGPGVPAAQANAGSQGGIRFACPFQGDKTRVYWDKPATLDLSRATTLELELSCARPEAIRSIGLYLKSGEGWHLWLTSLKEAGRQKLWLSIPDAAQEGRPAGMNAISSVRLSLTRRADVNAEVIVHALRIRSCDIVVIRASESVPNQDEGNAARNAAARWSHWLADLGIPHAVINDKDINSAALQPGESARVAILPYNPAPSRRELRTLASFVKRGGKLIVCYSSEPRLAEMMGLSLGNYQAAARPGQWSSFAFNRAAPPHTPAVVYQESSNIHPAFPDESGASVIANWRDSGGKAQSEPAWVRSDEGFWMSHILMDGDEANKKQMILAMLGCLNAPVWRDAAARAWVTSGKVASFQGLAESMDGIRRLDEADAVEPLLSRVEELDERMRSEGNRQQYAQAIETGRELNAALVRAYASVQSPQSPEFRGVWNHSGMGLCPGDWNATGRTLAEAGITAVFPNLAWAGTAHYTNRYVPESFISDKYGDQLKQSAAAARRYGLELHVWKVCWNLGQAPDSLVQQLRQAGRLQKTDAGKTLEWLCPSHPANIAQELNMISEMITRAEVNGIHLDYVRYPNSHACFCAGCRQRFEKWRGRSVSDWPADVKSGELKAGFSAWRTAQLTDFIRSARNLIRRRNPRIKLSAAVYPNYPECAGNLGQDWGVWLKEGLVDFVCPMDYTEEIAVFNAMTHRQLILPQARGRVFPGIGVTAMESRLAPDQVIEQILRTRAAGTGGFMLFDLTPSLARDVLPILGLGVTRTGD